MNLLYQATLYLKNEMRDVENIFREGTAVLRIRHLGRIG